MNSNNTLQNAVITNEMSCIFKIKYRLWKGGGIIEKIISSFSHYIITLI